MVFDCNIFIYSVFYKRYFYFMPRIWGIEKVLLIIMLRAIPIYLWNISLSLRVTPAIFKIFPRKKVALCKLRSLDYDTCSAKHCWFLQKLFTNIELKFAEPLYNSFWLTPRAPIITSEITNYHKFQIFHKLFLSHCYCLTSPVLLVPPFCLQLKQNLEADILFHFCTLYVRLFVLNVMVSLNVEVPQSLHSLIICYIFSAYTT